jgi:hypothetical protein
MISYRLSVFPADLFLLRQPLCLKFDKNPHYSIYKITMVKAYPSLHPSSGNNFFNMRADIENSWRSEEL